jgi:hypothetical protein
MLWPSLHLRRHFSPEHLQVHWIVELPGIRRGRPGALRESEIRLPLQIVERDQTLVGRRNRPGPASPP